MKIKDLKADENFSLKPDKIAARWGVIISDIREQNLNSQDAIDSLYIFTNQSMGFYEQ
ncbi:MAG: hypothetical protein IPM38_07365 [Ignavibacteria bacterium]|nr:hypothetical protein [Ignavibacteria bacterium]